MTVVVISIVKFVIIVLIIIHRLHPNSPRQQRFAAAGPANACCGPTCRACRRSSRRPSDSRPPPPAPPAGSRAPAASNRQRHPWQLVLEARLPATHLHELRLPDVVEVAVAQGAVHSDAARQHLARRREHQRVRRSARNLTHIPPPQCLDRPWHAELNSFALVSALSSL